MQRIFSKANSLMARCLISYMLIIILPTGILLNTIISHTTELMKSELQNVQDLIAHDVTATLNTRLSSIEKLSESFHYADAMRELIEAAGASEKEIVYDYFNGVDSFFNEMLIRNRYVAALHVYTENKRVNDLLYEFKSMDDIPLPPQNGWRVESGENGLEMTYFCRLYDESFIRSIGMIGLVCSTDIFLTALEDYGAENWYLTDGENLIYASAQPGEEGERSIHAHAADHRIKGDHAALLDDGTRMTVMYMDRLNMYLICESRWDAPVIANMDRFSIYRWVIGLCVLMNVVFFLFIVRPLNTISRLSAHMAGSELEPYEGKATQDEIGDLISSFNALVERTRKMIDTVRQSEFFRLNAQISALKAQIDPHFFYGTLESIRMIAEADGQESIAQIAYSFSQLMRYSLAERYYATVGEEIEVVKKYQDIQMWRMGMRIDFSWDVDPQALPVICPHFILHPLVENSIVHGASKTLLHTHIGVRIALENQQVVIEVSDNGPGISQQRLAEIRAAVQNLEHSSQMQSSENGRGILNVASRLQLYYGQACSLAIESEPFQKTSVRIAFSAEPPTLLVRDNG